MAQRSKRRPASRTELAQKPPTPALAPKLAMWQQATWFALVALALSFYLHFNSDKFPDPDIFYHFRHAALYAEHGLFDSRFPWARFSVIGQYSADIWYGFHILLVPFVWLGDALIGMRLAGVFVTAAFLLLIYLACLRLEIKAAPLWPFVLLFSSAFLLHRLTMLRPHVLSLGLSVLLLSFLTAGRIRALFIVAFSCAWLHLSLFFLPLIILAIFAMTKLLVEKSFAWRESMALIGGLAVGWLLRPNPFGAAQIVYVQVFQWTLEKLSGAPLEVGSELRPLTIALHSNYLAFIGLWSVALLLSGWKLIFSRTQFDAPLRTKGYTAAQLSLGFFLLAFLFARRAFDFSSAFAVVMIALLYSHMFLVPHWLRIGMLAAFAALALYGLALRDRVLAIGWPADRMAGAAEWLAANSRSGDLVFHARWEYFSELFFWNSKNHYIGGMDPIFQYAYDPVLYRAGLDVGAIQNSLLCPTGVCPEPLDHDRYRTLKEKFHARFVFLLKQPDVQLLRALLADPRFALRHHDADTAVFELL